MLDWLEKHWNLAYREARMTDTVAYFREQLAAKDAEIARLKREDFSHERLQNDSLKLALEVAQEQLLASQAREKQLREVLSNCHAAMLEFDIQRGGDLFGEDCREAEQALAIPSDDTALKKYVNQKLEDAANLVTSEAMCMQTDYAIAAAIRAMKT